MFVLDYWKKNHLIILHKTLIQNCETKLCDKTVTPSNYTKQLHKAVTQNNCL